MNQADDPPEAGAQPSGTATTSGAGRTPGMGGPVRGPSFTFGSPSESRPFSDDERGSAGEQAVGSAPLGTGPLPVPLAPGPPSRSKVPALVTLAVVLLVTLVAGVATVIADRADNRPDPTATSVAPTTAASTPAKGSIDFTSARGAGRLRVVEHTWRTTAGEPNSRLVIDVEITASSGRVNYDPYSFQAFDDRGQIFDIESDTTRTPLGVGSLEAGESVHGFLEFEMPRGEVTLLMNNDNAGSVTALRIDD